MGLYDKLTPDQQMAVIKNVAARYKGGASTGNIAAMLSGSDQATAQAMQYVGIDGVPQNMVEGQGDRMFNIDGLLDRAVGSGREGGGAAAAVVSQLPAQAQAAGSASRSNVDPTTGAGIEGDIPLPAAKPASVGDELIQQTEADGDGVSAGSVVAGAAVLGAGALLLYNALRAKKQTQGLTPDEEMYVNKVENGVEPTPEETAKVQSEIRNVPAKIENAVQLPVVVGPQPTQEQLRAQQALPGDTVRQPQLPGNIPPERQIEDMRGRPQDVINLPDQSQPLPRATRNVTSQAVDPTRAIPAPGVPQYDPNFMIPNVDIGMTPADSMAIPQSTGELADAIKNANRAARVKVRVKTP